MALLGALVVAMFLSAGAMAVLAASAATTACPSHELHSTILFEGPRDELGRHTVDLTIEQTTTISDCATTLTLSPSSAAPAASATATLSGAQPQVCTLETRTTARYLYQPVFDANGQIVRYNTVIQYTSEYLTMCSTNTAIVRFDGVVVATATLTSTGDLRAAFTVPNVAPGPHTVTATPAAGAAASATLTVLDTIPPLIVGSATRSPNAAGWYDSDVTVSFTCVDAESGIRSCTDLVTLTTEGAGQSVTGTAVDNAGNTATFTVSGINIDKSYPTITARASRAPDHGSWYTAPVTITFDCADALSGVRFCTGPLTLSEDGRAIVYTGEVFDNVGNGLSIANTVNLDQTPPTITAPADVISSTAAGVCSASPGLGTPVATDNLGTVTVANNAPAAFAKGTTTVQWTAADPAGHTATATQRVTVNDLERPTVIAPLRATVTATSSSGVVIANTALGSAASVDNCPGVAAPSVTGVPAGNLFPIGSTTLTWTAVDASGNTGSAAQVVTVQYGVCLLYDPTKAAKLGSAVPIKVQLCAASGANLSSPSLVPNATNVVRLGSATAAVAEDAGASNPDGNFRYDAALGGSGGYIYNLQTTGLSSGAWQMFFTVGAETYSVPFQVR